MPKNDEFVEAKLTDAVLKAAKGALTLYSEALDHVDPWQAFRQTLTQLDRYESLYSAEAASLIGKIKSSIQCGTDEYYFASIIISDWCGAINPLLTTYRDLFNDKAREQKDLLVEMLEKGMWDMSMAQNSIQRGSIDFNNAVGHLMALKHKIELEFEQRKEFFLSLSSAFPTKSLATSTIWTIVKNNIAPAFIDAPAHESNMKEHLDRIRIFFDELSKDVTNAMRSADKSNHRIMDKELQHIGELKVKTEETMTLVDLDEISDLHDTIAQSIQGLIDSCNNHRRKHAKKQRKPNCSPFSMCI